MHFSIKKRFLVILLSVLFIGKTYSEQREKIDVTQPLRIRSLFPAMLADNALGIDPALPEDFISVEYKGSDWIGWGKKSVLEAFEKNSDFDPLEPIFLVRITPHTIQEHPYTLNKTEILEMLKQAPHLKNQQVEFDSWEEYPYANITAIDNGKKFYMGYIGMNLPEKYMFHLTLRYPKEKAKQAEELWTNFFQNTKRLPDPLFFKALGTEMHKGYSLFRKLGTTIRINAERRKKDGKILLTIVCEEGKNQFSYVESEKGFMQSLWHQGELLVKIKGAVTVSDICQFTSHEVLNVLPEDVDEFTQVLPNKTKHIIEI